MSFQPVVPFGGYAGWKFLGRTLEAQKAAFEKSPSLQRDSDYFRANIGKVTTAAQLVGDRRLLTVALGAFGLDDDINSKAFIQKVLEGGTLNTDSLANKLSDKRYQAMSAAFGFGDFATPSTQLSDFADKIVSAYDDRQFEIAVGEQDPEMRMALSLQRDLADLAGKSSSEPTKWYTVMGTPALRSVFQTAFGLPSTFASIDIDTQLATFQDKADQVFGDNSVAQFADPDKMEKLVKLYLLRAQLQGGGASSGTAGQSAALTILQGAQSSAAGILSILAG